MEKEESKKELSREEAFEMSQRALEETEKSPEKEMEEVLAKIERDILEKRAKEEAERESRLKEQEEMAQFRKEQEDEKLGRTLEELERQKLGERLEGKLPQQKSRQEILEEAYRQRLKAGLLTPEEVGEQIKMNLVEVLDLIEAGILKVSRNEETGELLIHQNDLIDYLQNPRTSGRKFRSL